MLKSKKPSLMKKRKICHKEALLNAKYKSSKERNGEEIVLSHLSLNTRVTKIYFVGPVRWLNGQKHSLSNQIMEIQNWLRVQVPPGTDETKLGKDCLVYQAQMKAYFFFSILNIWSESLSLIRKWLLSSVHHTPRNIG